MVFKTEICRYVYIEELRSGKKEVALQTLYKQKVR